MKVESPTFPTELEHAVKKPQTASIKIIANKTETWISIIILSSYNPQNGLRFWVSFSEYSEPQPYTFFHQRKACRSPSPDRY